MECTLCTVPGMNCVFMQDVGSRENRKGFEEGLDPKVQYRLSKPLDTVSVLEIGLHADGFQISQSRIHQFAKAIRPNGFTWMARALNSIGWRRYHNQAGPDPK
jgi:hypothetical protein